MSKKAFSPVPGCSRPVLALVLGILAILSTHHPAHADDKDDLAFCAGRGSPPLAERLRTCDALLASGTISPENKARVYCNRAIVNRELGNHAAALKDVETAVSMSTDPYDSLLCRGNQYKFTGDLDRALADYDKAIAISPQRPEGFINRGHTYYARKNYERALEDYRIATGLDPNRASGFSARGLAQYQLKQYDEAIESFTIALKLDARLGRAYEGRYFTYKAKGDQEHAKADFDEWQRLKSSH
jgi:tetratricopeptide (TPR) repeat protein